MQANAAVQRDQAMLARALKQSDVLKAQLTRAEAEFLLHVGHFDDLDQMAVQQAGYFARGFGGRPHAAVDEGLE